MSITKVIGDFFKKDSKIDDNSDIEHKKIYDDGWSEIYSKIGDFSSAEEEKIIQEMYDFRDKQLKEFGASQLLIISDNMLFLDQNSQPAPATYQNLNSPHAVIQSGIKEYNTFLDNIKEYEPESKLSALFIRGKEQFIAPKLPLKVKDEKPLKDFVFDGENWMFINKEKNNEN